MMLKQLLLFFLFFNFFIHEKVYSKTYYPLIEAPIDVVIVSHPKDKETLDYCIAGIKQNSRKIRRIIVISAEKLTDKAEWFDESQFPFTVDEIMMTIAKGDRKKGKEFFENHNRPVGWYLQQLLKLYAAFIIPDISPNVLVIDADTIFMRPVKFLNESQGGLFGFNHIEAKERYLKHAERFLPNYVRIHPEVYSVCHHMLFQKPILDDLFHTIEQYHGVPFWVAFCACVDLNVNQGGASEYEIYFNYAFTHTNQVQLRRLKWTNSGYLNKMNEFKKRGYHYVSFHSYRRKTEKKR